MYKITGHAKQFFRCTRIQLEMSRKKKDSEPDIKPDKDFATILL